MIDLYSFLFFFFSSQPLQEAIREQKIDMKEIEANHLGTELENKIPEKKDDKAKAKSKASTSKS